MKFSQVSYLIGQAKEVWFLKIVLTTNAIKNNFLHSMEALSYTKSSTFYFDVNCEL